MYKIFVDTFSFPLGIYCREAGRKVSDIGSRKPNEKSVPRREGSSQMRNDCVLAGCWLLVTLRSGVEVEGWFKRQRRRILGESDHGQLFKRSFA